MSSGVTRVDEASAGDLLQFSGWGSRTRTTPETRERRVGVFVGPVESPLAWNGHAFVSGGDSGGPVAHAATGGAFGSVIGFHCGAGGADEYCGTAHGPTVAGIESLAATAGLTLRLRRAGEPPPFA